MSSDKLRPFHLAIPVDDLAAAHEFYRVVLGCGTGRTDSRWADLDFFGHQVTLHLVEGSRAETGAGPGGNAVDGDQVPARHFGVVLDWPDWQALAARLQDADVRFLIEPRVRFAGEVGEQATLFLCDPSNNAIEFKSFRDPSKLFAT